MNLDGIVTVLMPVYNAENYLNEAMDSILTQTYEDFNLLIIDDGSTDSSESIINSYNDSRIVFLKNETNMGIVKTLNKGLSLIESKYICRMDSDDIASEDRLEKQVTFMERNPQIAVSGSSVSKFSDQGKKKLLRVRTDSKQIRTHLLFDNALMHPTVIIRNSVIKTGELEYSENHIAMEDYGLWQKIALTHDVGNIDEVLLRYRENELGISHQAKKDVSGRDAAFATVYSHYFSLLGISLLESDVAVYRQFISGKGDLLDPNWLTQLSYVLKKIIEALDENMFDLHYLRVKWGQVFRINVVNNDITLKEARNIHSSYLKPLFPLQGLEIIKYVFQNLAK